MQALPKALHLGLPAEASAYEVAITWESYVNGTYQQATIHKHLTLRAQANEAGYALEVGSTAPTLTKPEDLEPLEQLALRLAALYGRVVVQAAPTGEITGLLNYEQLLQVWAGLAQGLRDTIAADDQVTPTILAFAEKQLQSPADVLRSLQHDYLYQALALGFCGQLLGDAGQAVRGRQFANFFDKVPLCFREGARVQPGATPEQLTLLLHGELDTQATDVGAVERLIAAQFQTSSPAGVPIPAVIPAPHFKYEAEYVLAPHTGMPLSIRLNVSVRAGLLYNKEYTLTIVSPSL